MCFPHAGGSASYFHPVSRALADVAEVLAVQYPGRQERRQEPALTDIGALADAVCAELRPQTGRRIILFGHSMGALIAFEVAVRLGRPVQHLVVSGRSAPSRCRDERVHTLGDEALIRELNSLDGTDQTLLADPELRAMIFPALRADYRAVETYRHAGGPPLNCPVTVLTGDADPKVTIHEAEAWREHTTGAFELRVFSGGHFFLRTHAAEVTDLLGRTALGSPAPDPKDTPR